MTSCLIWPPVIYILPRLVTTRVSVYHPFVGARDSGNFSVFTTVALGVLITIQAALQHSLVWKETVGIYRLESEAHPLSWQAGGAARSMSACFGACSSVGVCFCCALAAAVHAMHHQSVWPWRSCSANVHLPGRVWNHKDARSRPVLMDKE